ncbi:NUDIX hydrolase [Frigidibacter sp. SD6-1]|uniref:NUDIX domain-containing protein n=1 Tax=Frigidibacter sp. SD6-1 TaxID=3032581 RepID=UPI0024DFC691|nr:NUDIX hydrolase [Frigidibacter sp. SD6-1]
MGGTEVQDLRPRAAATVILVRRDGPEPTVLMGQRGAGAVFMPSKYVFPGGAVDAADADVALAAGLGPLCAARLGWQSDPGLETALAAAAVRELWEETGLALGAPGAAPQGWSGFETTGLAPSASALRFFFRAITPPGRPRRFDARFFLADAAALHADPDDFSRASDELSHLHWVPVAEARRLNLPFITEVVLAELSTLLGGLAPGAPLPAPASVPFFDNSGPVPTFRRIAA